MLHWRAACAPRAHRSRQLLQHWHGLRHAEHARLQKLTIHNVLAALLQVAFNHKASNARVARSHLRGDVLDGRRSDWRFACAAAELTAIESAQQTTHDNLQVHGGIGFTWEHDAHL